MSALGKGALHIEGPNPGLRMPGSSPSFHRALVLPSPAHLSLPPTLPRWLGPLHLPNLLRGHIASGPRHNPGSRNSPGLGPTHPLENFDEAQWLLQALPAQPQEQAVHLQRQNQQTVKAVRPEGKRGSPSTHIAGAGKAESDTFQITRWTGTSECPQAGHSGLTCWRGDLSEVRPGLSVEDMLARRGAVRGFDSLARRLRGARGRWGRRARGRGQAGLQAGGLGLGGAAARALGGSVRRAAPPAAENPRVRFKLLSNSLADLATESRGVRSRTLLPPLALPFFRA